MKANHPLEFMAASMTLELGNTDKLGVFHQKLDEMGIDLLGPDINASSHWFTVDRGHPGGGAIRYALAAIKNVGEAAMESVIHERDQNGPFKDIFDLAGRLDPHVVNKRQMENLARAGAFDSLNPNRRQVFSGIETLLRHASVAHNERDSGQMGLFGGAAEAVTPALPEISDWPKIERLQEEFDATGLYLSGHPLDDFGPALKRLKVKTAADIIASGKSGSKRMAGTLMDISERTSRKGNRYAFLSLMDMSGVYEVIVFSEILSGKRALLEIGNSFFIRANAQFEDETRFTVQSLESLDQAAADAAPGLAVVIDSPEPLNALRDVLAGRRQGQGQVRVISRLDDGSEAELELKDGYSVSADVIAVVRAIPGIIEAREI
jgi:DNA polymerase-3 subunit alpha